jgi:segregation and condensation protein A
MRRASGRGGPLTSALAAGTERLDAAPLRGTDAAVRFNDARAPERSTVISVDGFDGPIALLLSLIEARRMDVLTVPLGALAGAYLEALAALPADRLTNVSAFVAIASQLILIKSRALLPRRVEPAATGVDEPDPEAELRARLLLYRAHRDAGRRLVEAASGRPMFRREPAAAVASGRAGARPGPLPPMDPLRLRAALERATRVVPPPPPPPELVVRTVTIEERMAIVRAAIRSAGTLVLQELLADVRDRVVRAVTFLALLELAKRRELTIEQAEPWGPIVATRIENASGGAGA